MALTVLDPKDFTDNGLFTEDGFLAASEAFDYERLAGQQVLIRGCSDIPIPPWAYMHLTARLVGIAKTIRFGNEHDNIAVYRSKKPVAKGEPNE